MNNEHTTLQGHQLLLDGLSLEKGRTALHQQLYAELLDLIRRRTLPPGTRLPSSRALSDDLGISRTTVIHAYARLESEGYLETRPGSGNFVLDAPAADAAQAIAPPPRRAIRLSRRSRFIAAQPEHQSFPGRASFHPGTPDIRHFPFALWRRLLNQRLQPGGDDLFGYHHATGYPQLCQAIARHLAASRGVICTPEQVVVTTGAQAALDLLGRLLIDPGDLVWMEEPGHLGARGTLMGAGAEFAALRVDADGWHLQDEPASRLRAIFVTPSCQFPLGTSMRLEQRRHLLAIAARHDAWIIEDDFDAEYRFGPRPAPAMQGMDPSGRTIYLGTFSKTLFPALRLGFAVLPEELAAALGRASYITGQFAPLLLQGAVASFMAQGHFAQHLRRMRGLYAERRQLFARLCDDYLGRWLQRVVGMNGIQMCWLLERGLDDVAIAERAKAHGINVTPLSVHYIHPEGRRHGLIFGYAASDEAEMHRGLATMRAVLAGGRAA